MVTDGWRLVGGWTTFGYLPGRCTAHWSYVDVSKTGVPGVGGWRFTTVGTATAQGLGPLQAVGGWGYTQARQQHEHRDVVAGRRTQGTGRSRKRGRKIMVMA